MEITDVTINTLDENYLAIKFSSPEQYGKFYEIASKKFGHLVGKYKARHTVYLSKILDIKDLFNVIDEMK